MSDVQADSTKIQTLITDFATLGAKGWESKDVRRCQKMRVLIPEVACRIMHNYW